MLQKAPGWGKAIGIIMICLGGLGVFFQIYKLIIPIFFRSFGGPFSHMSNFNSEFSNVFGFSQTNMTMMIIFGIAGLGLTVFYIIGGVKLLNVGPSNYNMAKNALIAFISLNAIGIFYFFTGGGAIFLKMIMIYAIVGLVFDITLLIILLSSNKADYGFDADDTFEEYTIDAQSDEIL